MISRVLELLDNRRVVYLICVMLLAVSSRTPWQMEIVNLIGFLLFITEFTRFARWASTVFRICVWLMSAPFISIIILAFLSFIWKEVVADTVLTINFTLLFVGIWILAAIIFDKDKVKAAMIIINAVVASILALSFLANFVNYNSFLTAITNQIGVAPGTFMENIIKHLTLPYVLAGIWGMAIVELRYLKIKWGLD